LEKRKNLPRSKWLGYLYVDSGCLLKRSARMSRSLSRHSLIHRMTKLKQPTYSPILLMASNRQRRHLSLKAAAADQTNDRCCCLLNPCTIKATQSRSKRRDHYLPELEGVSCTCPFRAGPSDGPWPGTARHGPSTARHGRRRARAGSARGPCRAWAGWSAHGDGPSTAR